MCHSHPSFTYSFNSGYIVLAFFYLKVLFDFSLFILIVNLHTEQSFVRSEANAKSFARTIFLPLHMHSVFFKPI